MLLQWSNSGNYLYKQKRFLHLTVLEFDHFWQKQSWLQSQHTCRHVSDTYACRSCAANVRVTETGASQSLLRECQHDLSTSYETPPPKASTTSHRILLCTKTLVTKDEHWGTDHNQTIAQQLGETICKLHAWGRVNFQNI
jgi:hypothetical protein